MIIQKLLNFNRHPVSGQPHRLVYVDIALRDAAGRMTKQCFDGQFRETHIACDTGKSMPERVWGNVLQPSIGTDPFEGMHNSGETPVSSVCGKHEV